MNTKKDTEKVNKVLKEYFTEIDEFDINMMTNYHVHRIEDNNKPSILTIVTTKNLKSISASILLGNTDDDILSPKELKSKLKKIKGGLKNE